MVDPVAVAGALVLAVPGAWLALSGLFGIRAARRAGGLTPVTPDEVETGPVTVRGTVRPISADEVLPAPDAAGLSLVYTYRVVGLPDANASLDDGDILARGTAAVPFVVGDDEGILVGPEGAEVHLDGESVERVEGTPPDRVAEFLAFQEVDVDAEDAFAVVVSALAPGDEAFVTGLAERATDEAAADLPGQHVVRRGAGTVPFAVADSPDAAGSGRHVQRGIVHLVAGLLLLASGGVVGGVFVGL